MIAADAPFDGGDTAVDTADAAGGAGAAAAEGHADASSAAETPREIARGPLPAAS